MDGYRRPELGAFGSRSHFTGYRLNESAADKPHLKPYSTVSSRQASRFLRASVVPLGLARPRQRVAATASGRLPCLGRFPRRAGARAREPDPGGVAMDRDLLRQSLGCHGPALLSLLRSEQQDNPHFRSLLGTAAEPARGAAPPQGAGRYGGRSPGPGRGRAESGSPGVCGRALDPACRAGLLLLNH